MRTVLAMATTHTWLPVRGGRLAVSGRPGKTAFEALAAEGCTHVVTLLGENEDPMDVCARVERAGMTWLWLPMANGQPPPAARDGEIRAFLGQLRAILAGGGHVLVHCAAGIHRTGMITHALLRGCGLDAHAARAALAALRPVTAAGVGERRLAWAEELLARTRKAQRRRHDDEDRDEDRDDDGERALERVPRCGARGFEDGGVAKLRADVREAREEPREVIADDP